MGLGPETPPASGPVTTLKAARLMPGVPPALLVMTVVVGTPIPAKDDPVVGPPRDRRFPHDPRSVVPTPLPPGHAVPGPTTLDAAALAVLVKVVATGVAPLIAIAVVLVLPEVLILQERAVGPERPGANSHAMRLARDVVTATRGRRRLPEALEAGKGEAPADGVLPPDPMGLQDKAVDTSEARHQASPRPVMVMERADVIALRPPAGHQGPLLLRAAAPRAQIMDATLRITRPAGSTDLIQDPAHQIPVAPAVSHRGFSPRPLFAYRCHHRYAKRQNLAPRRPGNLVHRLVRAVHLAEPKVAKDHRLVVPHGP